ncbi:MAG: hypothetical protein H7249_03220 [Chitinophagaceae bacterium]|nr:hypothetical protein [Oligoflexus sp.]
MGWMTVLIIGLSSSSNALAEKKPSKVEKAVLASWYGSAGFTYFNQLPTKESGQEEIVSTNLQLGLRLNANTSVFVAASFQREPQGFQDIKTGVTTSRNLSDLVNGYLSLTASLPTSKLSREMSLTTQIAGASGVSLRNGPFSAQASIYGANSYYSLRPRKVSPGAPTPSPTNTALYSNSTSPKLTGGNKAAEQFLRPTSNAYLANTTNLEGTGEPTQTGTPQYVSVVLFDKYYGESVGVGYALSPKLFFDASMSLTRSDYANSIDVWTSEIIFVQLTWVRKSLSLFGNGGVLNTATSPLWPHTKTYSAGITYSFE